MTTLVTIPDRDSEGLRKAVSESLQRCGQGYGDEPGAVKHLGTSNTGKLLFLDLKGSVVFLESREDQTVEEGPSTGAVALSGKLSV